MRINATDDYNNFALLGNNAYDIRFMHYLFLSQNVSSCYCEKYKLDGLKDLNIRKLAYYFGNNGPLLIDNKGLVKVFEDNCVPRISDLPRITSRDIIDMIDMCLKSDVVYVCNRSGFLDRYTMFILGYLMAMEQEIFFWNDIDESEWLMASICKKNNNGYKEVVQFPLEIIRTCAYPYLYKKEKRKMDYQKELGVDRNLEFSLNVENQESENNTVTLLGSLRKHLTFIKEKALELNSFGYKILGPNLGSVKTNENGFVVFEDDISGDPILIESDFIEKCLKSERIIVCDKDGYVGNTVMFEIGYLLAKNKKIEFTQQPNDKWLINVVKHYSNLDMKLQYRR